MSLSLSKDANTIISGSEDNTLRIWHKTGHSYEFFSLYKQRRPALAVLLKDKAIYSTESEKVNIRAYSVESSFFDSLDIDYYYASLFYQAITKPTTIHTVEHLLLNLACLNGTEDGDHPEDEENLRSNRLKLHHGVNPLFWICLFQAPEVLEKALQNCDYEQWAYDQCDSFDPFLYSLRINNKDLIDVWADYFLKEENWNKLIVRDHDTLKMLFDSQSEKIQRLGILKFKGDSAIHRDIEPVQVCGYDKEKAYLYCFTRDCFIDLPTKRMLKDKEDISEEGATVTHESTLIPVSKRLSKLFWLITSVDNMAPQNKIELRPLILALFNKYLLYFYIYSVINFIGHLLFFIIIVFQRDNLALVIPFYFIYAFMAVFEIIDMLSQGFSYFASVYNWFDMLLYPSGMVVVLYAAQEKYNFLGVERENFIVVFILYVALLRMITMLRVVKPTRYLILMILRTYIDMTPFLVVMFIYIVGNGGIFMVINHTNSAVENLYTLKQLQISSDQMYNYGYGNWDGTDGMNDLTFCFYIHTGVFIGLVMFNLLIAIISGTYEEFVENRDMIDLEEIISMLTEMCSFLQFGLWLREKFIGKSKEKGVFYHFLIPIGEDEDDLKEIKKKLNEVEGGMRKNQEELTRRMDLMRNEINTKQIRMAENQRKMDLKIDRVLGLSNTSPSRLR